MAEFSESLKQMLLMSVPGAKLVSGGKEVLIRCIDCPDSMDINSAHFYISLGYDDKPPMYNCFKCGTKGLLTIETLNRMGIYDVDLGVSVTKYIKKKMSNPKSGFSNELIYTLYNDFITSCEISENKKKYINDRLGLDLTYRDLVDKKIVLNMLDVLGRNKITKYTRNIRVIPELNDFFIGFISKDNAYINMKNLNRGNVNPYIDKKYLNYNIFNKIDNSERFYLLPMKINMNNFRFKRIPIHIAEGPFDILSIYYNLRNKEEGIYMSLNGCGYFGILNVLLTRMKLFYSEIHFYMDNDVDIRVFNKIKMMLEFYNIPFYIHKNIKPGEKDFGEKIERIQEHIFQI